MFFSLEMIYRVWIRIFRAFTYTCMVREFLKNSGTAMFCLLWVYPSAYADWMTGFPMTQAATKP